MSSILKAIRKSEDDKRAQGNKAPDLMIDHGQSAMSKPKAPVALLVVGIMVGAVVVGGLSFVLSSGQKDNQVQISKTEQNSPGDAAPTAENPPAAKQPVTEKSAPENAPLPDASPAEPVTVKEVYVAPEKVVIAEPKVVKPVSVKTQQAVAPDKPIIAPSAPSVVEAPAQTEQKADLVVSEIFHQDDQASSMAVVNDLPVMVGTYIGDVLVKAINEDSVTFQASGKTFSLPLQTR